MFETQAFSAEIAVTFLIVAFTFYLFISDRFPTDINALIVLVIVGVVGQLPFLNPLLPDNLLFSGFSSSAVVSIIALMILAGGIEKTGGMDIVAKTILRFSGDSELKVVALFCLTAGLMSGFVQNIGVVALCMPVASYLSLHTRVAIHRLLMPMGFSVILGGNLTMIGNGSLIILNDLITSSSLLQTQNPDMPSIEGVGLFDILPVGGALLLSGVFAFSLFNRRLFSRTDEQADNQTKESLLQRFSVRDFAVIIPDDSILVGQIVAELEDHFELQVIAISSNTIPNQLSPFRSTVIDAQAKLGIAGKAGQIDTFLKATQLNERSYQSQFGDIAHRQGAGYSEVVISSRSPLINHTLAELYFRKYHSAAPVTIQRGSRFIGGGKVNHIKLAPGDILLLYSPNMALKTFNDNKSLTLINSECAEVEKQHNKAGLAAAFFVGGILLALLTSLPLELCLWGGVLGMFLSGIMRPNDAYRGVSWKTVILLAGLIPLGLAIDHTGAASWLGQHIISSMAQNPFLLQITLALVTTLLTLVMSNVGATILLVPVALSIAVQLDQNPLFWALIVAITSSNSFLIPTHQANALIMNAGRYKVSEFVRIGGIVSICYIAIELIALNLLFN